LAKKSNWLGLRLRLSENGADALGAVVKLQLPDGGSMLRRVRTSSSYVSANDPRVIFGLAKMAEQSELDVSVRWPDGKHESFALLSLRRYHQIVQGQGDSISEVK
jgi:hypothetical protein